MPPTSNYGHRPGLSDVSSPRCPPSWCTARSARPTGRPERSAAVRGKWPRRTGLPEAICGIGSNAGPRPPRAPRLPTKPMPVIALRPVSKGPLTASAESELRHQRLGEIMIILGIILLIIGFVAKIAIVWTIGIIVLVLGLIAILLGSLGHAIGGRRHYW